MKTLAISTVFLMLVCLNALAEQEKSDDEQEEYPLQKCIQYGTQGKYAQALKECQAFIDAKSRIYTFVTEACEEKEEFTKQCKAILHDVMDAVAYTMKSIAYSQIGSYEQSIEDATKIITLLKDLTIRDNTTFLDFLKDFDYASFDEIFSFAYAVRAASAYELAQETIGNYPTTEKEKQPYKKALQDINQAIALNPSLAESEQEIRELRSNLRRLAH